MEHTIIWTCYIVAFCQIFGFIGLYYTYSVVDANSKTVRMDNQDLKTAMIGYRKRISMLEEDRRSIVDTKIDSTSFVLTAHGVKLLPKGWIEAVNPLWGKDPAEKIDLLKSFKQEKENGSEVKA